MLHKIVLILSLSYLISCVNTAEQQQQASPPNNPVPTEFNLDAEHVHRTLQQFIENGNLVGVSALIYVDGQERFMGAFGHADREKNQSMSRDTLVRIFSMTKPITGVALMTLYEQGHFKLEDPLATHLPQYQDLKVYAGVDDAGKMLLEAPVRVPTMYDVVRHTAGFVSSHGGDNNPVVDLSRQINPGNMNNTLAQFSHQLADIPLMFQPGTRWLYGPSVDVQAAVIEKLSGMAFDDYVKQTILEPLRMTDTQWVVQPQQIERLAALYRRKDSGRFERIDDDLAYANYVKDWPMKHGETGLTSTLDDYMRFVRMLTHGGELEGVRILKPETVKLMASDALPTTVRDRSWLPSKGQVGFGVDFAVRIAEPASVEEASGEVGEFFWDGAANTMFWVDPVNKLGAVLFTQYLPFGTVPVHKAFRDAVYRHDTSASALAKGRRPASGMTD